MSFSQLRPNATIYILSKDGLPSVETGTILSVGAPTPKYGSNNAIQNPFLTQYGQPPEMVVDVTAKVQDKTGTFYKVSANAEVFDYTPQMMLSTSKEAINAEIASIRQRSVDIINSAGHNENIIKKCDELLAQLNPEIAEKQSQAQEIADLKQQVSELLEMNRQFMEALNGTPQSAEDRNGKK